jgi:phenylpropionate dioxygenase-like ring-hydroxylating dioxygenase large terminal subunit
MVETNEMQLPSGWYVVGTPREFRGRRPHTVRRFGVDWVLWRNSSQQWILQSDRCPHRGARLSQGEFTHRNGNGKCITCPFHGFEFDSEGECVHVPETGKAAPGLKLQTIHLVEKHGFLWMPWKAPTAPGPDIWFEDLCDKDFRYSEMVRDWDVHFTRSVENQLDYAHLPFLHRTTIGRGFNPAIAAEFTLDERALRVHLGSKGGGYFEYRFGNIWQLFISQNYRQTLCFVPVDGGTTRLYLRSYAGFTPFSWIRQWIARLSMPFNALILHQDYRVVRGQTPQDVTHPHGEILLRSDRAIYAFREWLKSSKKAT